MSGSMHSVFSGLKVTFDTPLSRFSTVRIGGGARIFVRAGSEEDVRLFLEACHAAGCRYFILGGGSNVLFDDRGFDGAVLHFGREMAQIYREGNRVLAQSGARLYGIYDCCRYYDLGGGEFLRNIPASLGGAIYNNAGCFGHDMSCITEKIYAVSRREKKVFEKDEAEFAYRKSFFQKNREWIITGALLNFHEGFDEAAAEEISFRKRKTQPLGSPSLGSVFKREGDVIPAMVIDRLGLKGLCVGGAQVSRVHANFIVNATRKATCDDYLSLMEIITGEVERYAGVILTPEVEHLEYRGGFFV